MRTSRRVNVHGLVLVDMVRHPKFPCRIFPPVVLGLLLGLLTAGSLRVAADPPQASPQLLVLRNGQVLRGQVSLHGDSYLVTLPYGEIRVPMEEVEHVCHTLEEGFRLKQSNLRFGSANQHFQLARWCLDHGLLGHARHQLALATNLEPQHRLAAIVRNRLAAATQQAAAVAEPVSHQQPATDPAQLDALVRRLPPGAVESFTNTIQPLLVNSCSARSCHGSAATNDFQLQRFPHGQRPRRRLTLRNLEAVMRWVDREDPKASRIWHAATHPHGPSQRSGSLSEPAQQKLRNWLGGLATSPPPATDRHAAAKSDIASFALPQKALHNPRDSDGTAQPVTQAPPSGTHSTNSYHPQDPFDPEIFNRRYQAP
ncbi:MAG: hypothetical protein GTO53_07625 [Planctomycetales bacterium]|nr:hypothetical protein [Planctomycetales bacterium]NIM09006.1 hypothetical protein [Planctomycetales bacterium]NIN08469.1 hypothetical protein [Planctomycetales bacterium]NIN77603.1 hypothetical protein [Planctomycetales bacterium]NIO34768.1 hypothetical protein [Planctomycetales bacterium]